MKRTRFLLTFLTAVFCFLMMGNSAKAKQDVLSLVPCYSGNPSVQVNEDKPFFTSEEMTTKAFENYSPLDGLGRCGVAYANICRELMPTEPRGEIGMVKPSGWHTVKYPEVIKDLYLYNRCHLIGYQLAGENANTRNLITGTRYLNIEGMLPYENLVTDYVQSTGNHVLYRVTPLYEGSNLVASGVLMEAKSVEDNGKGICFNRYCYNVQPAITINYANGDSSWDGSIPPAVAPALGENASASDASEVTRANPRQIVTRNTQPSAVDTYVLNVHTHKFHRPSCSSVGDIKPKNRKDVTDSRDAIIAKGYSPCKRCNP